MASPESPREAELLHHDYILYDRALGHYTLGSRSKKTEPKKTSVVTVDEVVNNK